jgi:hypothetical protein
MVTSDATVQLPPAEKTSLESEFRQAKRLYLLLAMAAAKSAIQARSSASSSASTSTQPRRFVTA